MNAKKLSPMKRFWRLLKPDQKEIRNVYAYAIFNGLIGLSLPLGIQAIVNLIQGGKISTSWIVLVVFVVLGIAANGVLQIFQLRITENLQQKIFTRAAFEFSYRIPKIRMKALYQHHAPELMNRFFDVMSVQKGLSKILIDFSAAALSVIFGLILLSLYHPFFILFSLFLVLLVLAIFRFTAKRGLMTSLEESKYKYQVAHWLEELARTASTFKLLSRSDLHLQKTDAEVGHYLKARENHFSILVIQYSLMVIFKVMVATGLLAIGGILVMEQLMNIGQFIAAEIIILMVMTSVEKLILSLETIYDVLTGIEKIGEVTDLELENLDGINLDEHCGENTLSVEINNVSFKYPGQDSYAIKNLSIDIRAGEKIVLTGSGATGKNTVLRLLAGLYFPQKGNISYNGLSIESLNLDSLRCVIGDSMSQEVLFRGSLLENISMGRTDVPMESVLWAVEKCKLNEFVKSLPKGLDTELDPEGKKTAASVTQKILLARSIVGKPKILLIADVLQSIPEEDRSEIIGFLMDKKQTWTLVMIASDQEVMKKADQVIELRGSLPAENIHLKKS